jgi:type IV fimbrial biogenesis protein FimT
MKAGEKGFTLIELMVTLAVAIVLLAIGIPAFEGMQANNRAVVMAQALVTALTLARTEAVGRGVAVAVCPKNAADQPGVAPSTTCGTNANWANGWFVFADSSGSVGVRDGTDEVIRAFPTPRGTPVITKAPTYVRFSTQGFLSDGTLNVPAAVSLELAQTGSSSNQKRCVTVASLGQPRTDRSACP